MARSLAFAFLALFMAACGGTTATEGGGAVVVTPSSMGTDMATFHCNLGDTFCLGDNSPWLLECTPPGILTFSTECKLGCFPSKDTSGGHEHDYCGLCTPGEQFCENHDIKYLCGADHRYHPEGTCPKCPCGGAPPNCTSCK